MSSCKIERMIMMMRNYVYFSIYIFKYVLHICQRSSNLLHLIQNCKNYQKPYHHEIYSRILRYELKPKIVFAQNVSKHIYYLVLMTIDCCSTSNANQLYRQQANVHCYLNMNPANHLQWEI